MLRIMIKCTSCHLFQYGGLKNALRKFKIDVSFSFHLSGPILGFHLHSHKF